MDITLRRRLLTVVLVALGASLMFGAQARAATSSFAHYGHAWGTRMNVGTAVKSGETWPASLGACTAHTGDRNENSALSTSVPNVLTTGSVDNVVNSTVAGGMTLTRSTADIQNANLLGGAITATTLHAQSEVHWTGSGFGFRNGSTAVGLSILGKTTTITAPNTRIDVAGLGYVIVNEQKRTVGQTFAEQSVNLLHVFVTVASNTFGLSKGTDIVVAHADAGLSIPSAGGPMTGAAYGTFAQVGSVAKSGRSAPAGVPCLGGRTENQVLSSNVPNLITTDTILDTGVGVLTGSLSTATSESNVQGANLLGGLVTAAVIKSHSRGTFDGTTHKFDHAVSFTNLVVDGQQVSTPKMNTTISISGLGTLYLNRVIQGAKGIEVRALELVVTVPSNSFGLANGTDLRVAVSSVGFRD